MSKETTDKKTRFTADYEGVATEVFNSQYEVIILAPSQATLEHFLSSEIPKMEWNPDAFKRAKIRRVTGD